MCVISLSYHMMDYTSVFLILIIGSCTHSTGDSLFYYCLYLIVHVILIVFFCLQLLEKSGKMSKLQKPQRYSSPDVEWIHFVWLFWIHFTEILKIFFVFSVCTCRLILTCRSSAHRWPAYPHHHQVKPAWPSIILHHSCRNERCWQC